MQKLSELQNQLQNHKLDAFLVTNPINRRYITNFTGTAGVSLITKTDAFLITDFRYTEQAKEQASEFTVIQHTGTIEEELQSLLTELHIKFLGFEEDHVTYGQYKLYEKSFSTQLIGVKGMIEALRMIKSDEEITILQKAAQIADDAFEHILQYIKPGVREIEIAHELEFFMR